MTRLLRAIDGVEILPALREALAANGDAVFAGVPSSPLPAEVPQKVALVVQSSGTSGAPKRVALSADAVLASAAASEGALGVGQWLLALPLSYIAGINVAVRGMSSGFELITMRQGSFTPAAFVEAVDRMTESSRFVSLVPTQLQRILEVDAATRALAGFERVLLGGQAAPPSLIERAAAHGIRVTRTYGSSETSGGCVYDGKLIGAARARIVAGQIELSGPTLAEGYLNDPERTDAAFHTDEGTRWYRTGDFGALAEGTLTVTGRLDDVIISGGEKVALGDVETAVRAIAGLENAVVVRSPSAEWGEVPVVYSTVDVELAEVRAAVGDKLGAPAAPAAIYLVSDIPLLRSGKPDRASLVARLPR